MAHLLLDFISTDDHGWEGVAHPDNLVGRLVENPNPKTQSKQPNP